MREVQLLWIVLLITIITDVSLASRFLSQGKACEVWVPAKIPSKSEYRNDADEILQCEQSKAGKGSFTSPRHPYRPAEDCTDHAVNRQFEDSDYIYTNSRP